MAGTVGANISPSSIPVKASLHMKPKEDTIWPMERATHQIILAQSTEI